MPSHILVRRHAWAGGLVYVVVGGPEHGRPLTVAQYADYVDRGVPVIRSRA